MSARDAAAQPGAAARRVVVTGASGFVGSRLVRRLVADGVEVHVLTRAETSLGELRDAAAAVLPHRADGGAEALCAALEAARPEVVFHLAARFVAEHRTADVTPLVESNVLFTAQLAEAAAVAGVPALVNTGTSWQHYGDADYDPVSLYAATKQAAEDVLAFYARAGRLRVTTLRLFDTYGPGDPRPKLLALLRRAARGERLAMSPGDQAIDLVHVDDVVAAYLRAWERLVAGEGAPGEAFAVSTGAPIRLRDLAALYGQLAGTPLAIDWGARPYRAREVMRPWRHGRWLPGWAPRIPLEEGLRALLAVEP